MFIKNTFKVYNSLIKTQQIDGKKNLFEIE